LHGCTDGQAKREIQFCRRDHDLLEIVLEELTAARVPAEIATDRCSVVTCGTSSRFMAAF
jgi:hypothetical protein